MLRKSDAAKLRVTVIDRTALLIAEAENEMKHETKDIDR